MAVLMLIILCWKLVKEQEYRKIPIFMIPAGVYGLFVIISTIFSVDKTISLHGIMEQFELVTVLIGYIIFLFSGRGYIRSRTIPKLKDCIIKEKYIENKPLGRVAYFHINL